MTRYDYAVHWYALLFPELPADEYEKLKEDIRANGQLQPIVIAKKDDGNYELLDGRHRIKICQELGITPYTVLFRDVHNVRAEMTEVDFIDSVNLHRRHMTDDQRAQLAVARSEGLEKAAKEQRKRKSVLVKSPKQKPMNVRKELAKQTGLPENKIRVAQELAKRDPEAAKQVTQGKISAKEARQRLETAADIDKRLVRRDNAAFARSQGLSASPQFQEDKVLNQIEIEIQKTIIKLWPTNRDLAPLVQRLRKLAYDLESAQIKTSGELEKTVQAVGAS